LTPQAPKKTGRNRLVAAATDACQRYLCAFVLTVCIHPGTISGTLAAPPSKSFTQRILATLLVCGDSLRISNPGYSADERVLLDLLREAGFWLSANNEGDLLLHLARQRQPVTYADFGSSALAARMLTPLLALQPDIVRLEASLQLRTRPMPFLATWLPRLGVRVASTGGRLPASMQGPLTPADITVDSSLSSQPLSGLLMAYAAAGAAGKTIEVSELASRPYIDLTLQTMELMGLPLPCNEGYRRFIFPESLPPLNMPGHVHIEGDWSAAAFLMAAAAIAGELCITGLDVFSLQADKRVLEALMESQVAMSVEESQIRISKTGRLRPFQFDATDSPDLFPPLAVLACYAEGTSAIRGVDRLRYKESNRAASIIEELRRMGADLRLQDDYLIIRGGQPLQGADLRSHGDHRIAMMCAVAALGAQGDTYIADAEAVEKSYPQFFQDLQRIGIRIDYDQR
jgi:3-phosphoshikimate 1-carboxyvinyltransferase